MKTMKFGMMAGVAACLVTAAARADIQLTETGFNSTVNFNQSGSTVTSMNAWVVDGVDHLFEQWFWYRTSTDTQEHRLENLGTQSFTNPVENILNLKQNDTAGTGLVIDVTYVLTGGTNGSNFSDIAETIRIRNMGSTAISMTFFQYSDFDLNGSIQDQSVEETDINSWSQVHESGLILSETFANSNPDRSHREAAIYSDTVDRLNDNALITLSDVGALSGGGDYTWAWQWDFTIAAGGSVLISKDKQISPIPAPGAVVLAMMGMGLVGWVKRRIQ